ncbi:MAG: FkbM family methyltransferase [Verrucomicrobiota bacterium]
MKLPNLRFRLYRLISRLRPAILAVAVKRLCGVRRLAYATPGGVFFIDPCSNLGLSLAQSGVYEPGMRQVFEEMLRPGGTCIDLGANEGYFTVTAARIVGPTGRVVAVEPQSRLRQIILRNLELNGLQGIAVEKVGISDRDGTAKLFLFPNVNTGASGFLRQTKYPVPSERVPVITLEALLKKYRVESCDLLKIDVEGFEYEVVLGSKDVFLRHVPKAIALELHPHALSMRGLRQSAITDFLEQAGYARDQRFQNVVYAVSECHANPGQ